MRVEVLEKNMRPAPSHSVTVKEMGAIVEVRYIARESTCPIIKLDEKSYVEISSGEVKDFERKEKRIDDISSIQQSLKRLREIINTNVTDHKKCKWLTLTYKENMQDEGRLYSDFKNYNSRMRYWLKTKGLDIYEYIAVAEPQGRGSFHLHCFLLFPKKAPYIPHEVIKEIWGHGAINVKAMKDIDDVGIYFAAYISDISITEHRGNISGGIRKVEEINESGEKISKKYVKGGRLKFYAAGFRFYRVSRGVKRPTVYKCTECEAMALVGSAPMTYEKTIRLFDEETGGVINTYHYRQFNKRRKRSNDNGQQI